MTAFHGDPKVKEVLLEQLHADAATDDHSSYELMYGIPLAIVTGVFRESEKTNFIEFLEAIPVGADLSLIWPKFAVWLMQELEPFEKAGICGQVALLYSRRIKGDEPSIEEWKKASAAAAEVAANADYNSVRYATAAATEAAAEAGYYSDDYAAVAATAAFAAVGHIYAKQNTKLIELLMEAS